MGDDRAARPPDGLVFGRVEASGHRIDPSIAAACPDDHCREEDT